MKEIKKIVFREGFWYDDEMYVEAGEYDYSPASGFGWDEVLIDDEWFDFCNIDALDYYVKDDEEDIKELTKEEIRTINYWSHCVKEVARTHNIDLQYFIDALSKENKK